MAPKPKTIGGGNARPLADDFLEFLSRGLNTGTFGAGGTGNPINDTKGIAGILNEILGSGAGKFGGSLQDMIAKETEGGAAALRARYGAGGGMSYGTPAAMAESGFRADQAMKAPLAIGNLQLQALASLFPMYSQALGLGTPQAQTVMQQNPFAGILNTVAPVAGAVLSGGATLPFSAASAAIPGGGTTRGLIDMASYEPYVIPRG